MNFWVIGITLLHLLPFGETFDGWNFLGDWDSLILREAQTIKYYVKCTYLSDFNFGITFSSSFLKSFPLSRRLDSYGI